MKEIIGNLWNYHTGRSTVVITTNGYIRSDGALVMGRGVAKEALDRFPGINKRLGALVRGLGNHVHHLSDIGIISFPVKHKFFEDADIHLIQVSSIELRELLLMNGLTEVYMPRPGCGNGRLDWANVRHTIEPYLGDLVTIVNNGS